MYCIKLKKEHAIKNLLEKGRIKAYTSFNSILKSGGFYGKKEFNAQAKAGFPVIFSLTFLHLTFYTN